MNRNDPDIPDSLEEDPREERIGELINDFLDRRGRGEAISEDEFLRLHPEFAGDLRGHFESLRLIGDFGPIPSSSEATLPGGTPPTPKGSSASPRSKPGSVPLPSLPGYEVQKQIGRGGMGVVFKAVQISTKRIVALKLLLEGPFASPTARLRFEREIALAAQLRHPHIIPIYDSGENDGRMYYAMEHVYGLPLMDYVRAHKPSIPAKLKLFVKICDAVSHAHQRGVVHRDLKPTNILIDGDGDPHILDFGLAKAGGLGDMNLSMTAQIVGTPAYMSPEQAAGDPGGIDTRTDVYSLGIMLYEMLTGRLPYSTTGPIGTTLHNIAHAEPESPRKTEPAIDEDLEAVVLKAIEKSKDSRYQSTPSLQQDIQNYLTDQPLSVRPASVLTMIRKSAKRHRAAIGIVAVLLFGAIGLVLFVRGSIYKSELEQQLAVKEQQVKDLTDDRVRPTAKTEFSQKDREAALDILLTQMGVSVDDRRLIILAARELGPNFRITDFLTYLPRLLAEAQLAGDSERAPATSSPAELGGTPSEAVFDPEGLKRFVDVLRRAGSKVPIIPQTTTQPGSSVVP